MPTTLLALSGDALPANLSEWREGLQVGHFLLQRCLGSGGMGVVWLALQIAPLRRQVALKVMGGDDGSPLGQALFELERQALARLSHRAIAQIHDAGRLPDGALYFAMEYVDGVPLHRFVREQRPALRDLAALMVELCRGVQHAHQRNLIHRDIKPANVLVQQVDGALLPRLIDFGIVLSSHAGLSPQSGAGTRGYMPPEQLEPDARGLDQRTDVYGLGAVLGECLCLLAGVEQPSGRFDSVHARAVLQQTLDGRTTRVLPAPDRRATLDPLRRLPAELRAIARKALAPDREQRYDTAEAMAQDLRRWLDGQPVQALPPTRRYVWRCWLRRHAVASVAAAVVLAAVLIGLGLALYGLREAQAQRAVADAARELAERRRDDAERLIGFMLGDLAERLRPLGRLDLLDAVATEAMAYVGRQEAPSDARSALHQAQSLRTLAGVQLGRDQNAAAEATLQQAASLLAPWVRDSDDAELHKLAGEIAFRQGRIAYAAKRFDAAAAFWQENLAHARVLEQVAPGAPESRTAMASALQNLAVLELEGRHRWESALDHIERVKTLLASGEENADPHTQSLLANAWNWQALAELELGQSVAAWHSFRQALAALRLSSDQTDSFQRLVGIELTMLIAQHAADLGLTEDAARAWEQAYALAIAQAGLEEHNPKARRRLARIAFHAALASEAPQSVEVAQRMALAEACLSEVACLGADPSRRLELEVLGRLAQFHVGRPSPERESAVGLLDQGLAEASPTPLRLRVLVALCQYLPMSEDRRRQFVDAAARIAPELRASLRYQLLQFEMLTLLEPHSDALRSLAAGINRVRAEVGGHPIP